MTTQATSKCSALNVTEMMDHLPKKARILLDRYLSGDAKLTDIELSLNTLEYKTLIDALKNVTGFGGSTQRYVKIVEDNSTNVTTQESNETKTEVSETAEPTVTPQAEILSDEETAGNTTKTDAAELVKTTTIANAVFGGGGLIAAVKAFLTGKKVRNLQQLLGEANTKKADLGRTLDEANTAKTGLEARLNEANTAKTVLEDKLSQANAKADSLQDALNKEKQAVGELTEKNKGLTEDLGEANAAKEALQDQNVDLGNQLRAANTEKAELGNQLKEANAKNKGLTDELGEAKTANEGLKGQLETADAEKARLQGELRAANTAKAELGRQLGDAQKANEALQGKNAELQRNLESATRENTQLPGQNEESVSKLEADADELRIQNDIDSLYKATDELSAVIEKLTEHNGPLQDQNADLGRQLDEAKAEKEELDKKAKELKKQIEELEKMRSDRKDADTNTDEKPNRNDAEVNTDEKKDSDDDRKSIGFDAVLALGVEILSLNSNDAGKRSAQRNRFGIGGLVLTAAAAIRVIRCVIDILRGHRSSPETLRVADELEALVEQENRTTASNIRRSHSLPDLRVPAVVEEPETQTTEPVRPADEANVSNELPPIVEPEAPTDEGQSADDKDLEQFEEDENDVATSKVEEEEDVDSTEIPASGSEEDLENLSTGENAYESFNSVSDCDDDGFTGREVFQENVDDATQDEGTPCTPVHQDVGANVDTDNLDEGAPLFTLRTPVNQGTARLTPLSSRRRNMLRTSGSAMSDGSTGDTAYAAIRALQAEIEQLQDEVEADLKAAEPANVYARVFAEGNLGETLRILDSMDTFRQALDESQKIDGEWVNQVFSNDFECLLDQVRQALVDVNNSSYDDVESQLIRRTLEQNSIDSSIFRIGTTVADNQESQAVLGAVYLNDEAEELPVTFDQAIQALIDAGCTNEDAMIMQLGNARDMLSGVLDAIELVLTSQSESVNPLDDVAKAITFASDDEPQNEDVDGAQNEAGQGQSESVVSQSGAGNFSLFDAEEDGAEKSECTTRKQEDEKAKKTPKK